MTNQVDLAVTLAPSNNSAPVAGLPFAYTLTVTNNGPDTARDVNVLLSFPPGVTHQTAVQLPPDWRCTPQSDSPGGQARCSVASLASKANAPLSLSVLIDQGAGGTQRDIEASVATTDQDTDSSNDKKSLPLTIGAQFCLTFGDASPQSIPYQPSPAEITYQLTLKNSGPSTAKGVTLQARKNWNTPPPAPLPDLSISINNQTSPLTIPLVPPGPNPGTPSETPFTVTITDPAGFEAIEAFDLVMEVNSNGTACQPGAKTALTLTTRITDPDVKFTAGITPQSPNNSLIAGRPFSYNLSVTNSSTSPGRNVNLSMADTGWNNR